jgi:hypothetical protein
VIGFPTSSFTVSLNGIYNGIVSLSDSGSGGTFTPIFLTWFLSSNPQTFTYTPSVGGTIPISISASPSLAILGSPIELAVSLAAPQFFEQALVARLQAIPELMALLGAPMVFKTSIPQNWDFNRNGHALTYTIPTKSRGQVLSGSDGTAIATTQIDAWGYDAGTVKMIAETIFNGLNGVPGVWGNGTCTILSVVQQDEPPRAGTDQWLYHTTAEYAIKYRVSIPTLA